MYNSYVGATPTNQTESSPSSALATQSVKRMVRPVVVSGPSGGGKSTILKKAMEDYPDAFAFSVSHTTRQPRPGEVNGKDYWYTSVIEMTAMINDGKFIEHAVFSGNMYGTSKQAVRDVQDTGRICVLDLELQGVRNIKQTDLNAKFILVRPPSMDILEKRLRDRKTETEESLQKRLRHAQEDLDAVAAEPGLFDHVVINDTIEHAYKDFLVAIDDELQAFKHSAKV